MPVPRVAGDAEPAPLEGAVDDHRAPDARPEVHAHQVGLAPAGAEPPLGPDRGVRVVLDHDGQPEPRADGLAQGLVAPGQVRGEQHVGPVGVDEAGRPDAHGVDLVPLRQVEDGVDDGVLHHLRALAAVRRLAAYLVDHLTVEGDDAGSHLRAPDVDAHGQQLGGERADPQGSRGLVPQRPPEQGRAAIGHGEDSNREDVRESGTPGGGSRPRRRWAARPGPPRSAGRRTPPGSVPSAWPTPAPP